MNNSFLAAPPLQRRLPEGAGTVYNPAACSCRERVRAGWSRTDNMEQTEPVRGGPVNSVVCLRCEPGFSRGRWQRASVSVRSGRETGTGCGSAPCCSCGRGRRRCGAASGSASGTRTCGRLGDGDSCRRNDRARHTHSTCRWGRSAAGAAVVGLRETTYHRRRCPDGYASFRRTSRPHSGDHRCVFHPGP